MEPTVVVSVRVRRSTSDRPHQPHHCSQLPTVRDIPNFKGLDNDPTPDQSENPADVGRFSVRAWRACARLWDTMTGDLTATPLDFSDRDGENLLTDKNLAKEVTRSNLPDFSDQNGKNS